MSFRLKTFVGHCAGNARHMPPHTRVVVVAILLILMDTLAGCTSRLEAMAELGDSQAVLALLDQGEQADRLAAIALCRLQRPSPGGATPP
jgi:hypothetical protein